MDGEVLVKRFIVLITIFNDVLDTLLECDFSDVNVRALLWYSWSSFFIDILVLFHQVVEHGGFTVKLRDDLSELFLSLSCLQAYCVVLSSINRNPLVSPDCFHLVVWESCHVIIEGGLKEFGVRNQRRIHLFDLGEESHKHARVMRWKSLGEYHVKEHVGSFTQGFRVLIWKAGVDDISHA